MRAGVVLRVRGARQVHPGRGVGEGREARAVETGVAVGRPVAAPDVRQPDLRHRGADRGLGPLVGQVGGERRRSFLRRRRGPEGRQLCADRRQLQAGNGQLRAE